ncbi:glycosyltransferase family 4 protein [Nostoc sp. UHCC 0870]
MNILIIGKDPTVFENSPYVFGDTQKRHQNYAQVLQEHCGTNSSIRMISYTPRDSKYQVQQLQQGLTLYPTRSLHRSTFIIDVIRLLPSVLYNWQPDVITVQTPWEEGILGYVLSRILGVRFLLQLHFDLFSPDWQKEHWLNSWRKLIASQLIRRADGVRVVSEILQDKVVKFLNLSVKQVFVVPVGVNFTPANSLVDKNDYKAKLNPKIAGKPVVLFVGRICIAKNLPLWIEVASRITQYLPETQFIMAGDGLLLTDIQTLVAKKKLTDQFHFLGKVGYESLPEVYAAADAFLLTSHNEGYGRVIVESLLSGVPVVSTACTGPEDLIVDGINGFLLPLGDVTGLSNKVIKLLQDKQQAQSMGNVGRERMLAMFSNTSLAERLIECWLTVTRSPVEV